MRTKRGDDEGGSCLGCLVLIVVFCILLSVYRIEDALKTQPIPSAGKQP